MAKGTPEQDYGALIEGHTYDGIKEYDNPMPRWWLILFYLTIAWSVYYVIAISFGWINDYGASLEAENALIDARRAEAQGLAPQVTPEYLAQAIAAKTNIDEGKAAFAAYCAACHADNGGGGIGPNLTDNAWLHGGSPMEVYDVVDKGVTDKGMPAWGNILKPEQHVGVVVFIDSLRNTNVAGGKEAQGTPYEP